MHIIVLVKLEGGIKDCPLIEEIEHIDNLFTNSSILIIDDYRLFGTNITEDWRDISKEKIVSILSSRIDKIYHLDDEFARDDKLIIHINPKNN